MTLTLTLDWLTVTFKEIGHESTEFCNRFARRETVQAETARFGYTTAIRDQNGVVSMWNTAREEMGLHVIFAGSALRNVFEYAEVHQRGLVKACLDAGGRITRLDLAKDLTDVSCDISAVYDAVRTGKSKGTTRSVSRLDSGKKGITVYLGSRSSERFARIYNKAAQLGLEGVEWSRFELETKGMVARSLAYLLSNEEAWSGAFDAMALGMVDLPGNEEYAKFFQPGETLIGIPQIEKKTDRERWIKEQCMPAIAKHYVEHRDSAAVSLLIDMLIYIRDH